MSNVGSRIDHIIKSLGITQYRFAKSLETSSTRISNIVSEKNKPDLNLIHKILDVYTISPVWLFFGLGDMLFDKSIYETNEVEVDQSISKLINRLKLHLNNIKLVVDLYKNRYNIKVNQDIYLKSGQDAILIFDQKIEYLHITSKEDKIILEDDLKYIAGVFLMRFIDLFSLYRRGIENDKLSIRSEYSKLEAMQTPVSFEDYLNRKR